MVYQYKSRIYMIAVFSALASLLQLLEIFIILPVPFVKIGLANAIVLFFLARKEYGTAFMINIIRVFIGGFYSGKLFSLPFMFSITGASASYFIMFLLIFIFRKKISLIAVSISGAVIFNTVQYFLFLFFFGGDISYGKTLGVITLLSIIPGVLTGTVAYYLNETDITIKKAPQNQRG